MLGDSAVRVGIGTTDRLSRLTVKGRASFTATGAVSVPPFGSTVTGSGTKFISEVGIGDRIQIGGQIRIVTAIASDASLTVSSLFFSSVSGSMTVFPALLRLDDAVGNVTLAVSDEGKVGVGTITPSEKLEVGGKLQLTGDGTGIIFSITRRRRRRRRAAEARPPATMPSCKTLPAPPTPPVAGGRLGLTPSSTTTRPSGTKPESMGRTPISRARTTPFSATGPGTASQLQNATAIGANALVSADNSLVLGDSSVNVGIGTSTPNDRLHVAGDIRIGTGGMGGVKDSDATVIAGMCPSDARFKKNIQPFPALLDKVVRLQPVHFDWRAEEYAEYHFGLTRNAGLIARRWRRSFQNWLEWTPGVRQPVKLQVAVR